MSAVQIIAAVLLVPAIIFALYCADLLAESIVADVEHNAADREQKRRHGGKAECKAGPKMSD